MYEYPIVTRRAGRVESVLVGSGDLVENGQAVARLDTGDLQTELRQANAALKLARDGKERALAAVAQKESDIEQALAAIRQRAGKLSAANEKAKRSEALLEKQYIAKREFEQDQIRRQAAQAALDYELARKRNAEAALKAAQLQIFQRDAAITVAGRDIHRIRTEIADSVLTAPIRGRIWRQHVEPGAVLAAGDTVMTLLRPDEIAMTISLAGSVAEQVTVGSEARIVFDGAPAYVIAARVSSVTPDPGMHVEKQTADARPASLIEIKIDPEQLKDYLKKIKADLHGVAHVRLDPDVPWPDHLRIKIAR